MPRSLYLTHADHGDLLDDVFLIANKQLGTTQTGKNFLKALISDRSAQLNARMWNVTRQRFDAMPDGGFVRIKGRIEKYQENLQVIVDEMLTADEGTFELADLMPTTSKDVPAMMAKVIELCESIQNRHLCALVQVYLDDEKLMADFARAPAAMSMHHAYIGGLLEHTLNAMEVADAVAAFYPGLNRDLLVAGIFLHDIAKTWELRYVTAFGYTDGGQLVGHIVKSAMWLEHKAKLAEEALNEKIPQPLIDVLQHIIISHHGVPEFGAVKTPATPEAIAVHMIENMDAKLMMALTARAEGGGAFTDYQKAFGGRLYRPDVAPADAPLGETLDGVDNHAPVTLKIDNPLFENVSKNG